MYHLRDNWWDFVKVFSLGLKKFVRVYHMVDVVVSWCCGGGV